MTEGSTGGGAFRSGFMWMMGAAGAIVLLFGLYVVYEAVQLARSTPAGMPIPQGKIRTACLVAIEEANLKVADLNGLELAGDPTTYDDRGTEGACPVSMGGERGVMRISQDCVGTPNQYCVRLQGLTIGYKRYY